MRAHPRGDESISRLALDSRRGLRASRERRPPVRGLAAPRSDTDAVRRKCASCGRFLRNIPIRGVIQKLDDGFTASKPGVARLGTVSPFPGPRGGGGHLSSRYRSELLAVPTL